MEDPLASVECRSKFHKPIRLSFEIVLTDDVISVSFSHLPENNEPWYGDHESSKHGSGMFPLYNVKGGPKATPEAIAEDDNMYKYLLDKLRSNGVVFSDEHPFM